MPSFSSWILTIISYYANWREFCHLHRSLAQALCCLLYFLASVWAISKSKWYSFLWESTVLKRLWGLSMGELLEAGSDPSSFVPVCTVIELLATKSPRLLLLQLPFLWSKQKKRRTRHGHTTLVCCPKASGHHRSDSCSVSSTLLLA